jgi:hypothetical protein
MLELETMDHQRSVGPGEVAELTETWSLHRPVALPEISDAALDAVFLPLLK